MLHRLIIITIISIFVSCKGEQKSEAPADAINPDVVENPATAAPGNSKDNVPVFKFEKETHDFGKITEGEKVSFAFRFTNAGTGDLVIRSAQGSCGCTVPDYPKEAIKPGKGGLINVSFDSEGREGVQSKTVTLIANTIPNTYTLTINSEVIKAAE